MQTSVIRFEIKKIMVGFVSLLGSSVISAVGFIIIASNRLISFDSASAVSLILFVQWQTLGLTIAKLGIEQVVFAMVSENNRSFLDPAKFVFRKALPLAAFFSLIVLYIFSLWAACVTFLTILLDTWSLIIVADMNARQRFKTTALSNLFNYPLFFFIIFTVNYLGTLTTTLTLAIFLLTSFLRWLWLWCNKTVRSEMQEVVCTANVQMGLQQTLNYILFRADQILLAVLGLKLQSAANASIYVFLAKFPELVSGVMVVVGTVIFPRVYLKYPFDRQTLVGTIKSFSGFICAYVAVVSLAFFVYLLIWKGGALSFYLTIPFLLHALCVILVNNITYSALRQGYLQKLLTNLSWAVLAGGALFLLLQTRFSISALPWLVPLQLLLFITLSLTLDWGRRRELHV